MKYVRYTNRRYPVPDLPFPFPTYHPSEGTGSLSPHPHFASHESRTPTGCAARTMSLPFKVAFVITPRPEQEGITLQVLSFFVFVLTAAFATSALGYGLSLFEERAASRRCRVPQEMLRRRKAHRQRVRCRFEG